MKWLDWKNCYNVSAKGFIVDEAFSHPAKMSISLCRRIFKFMEDKGMITAGSTIVDPFGGIGITGIIGATEGYRVICVELEEKFVLLAHQNFKKHELAWKHLDCPLPIMLQGDSRMLWQVIAAADALITSPPFGDPHTGGGISQARKRDAEQFGVRQGRKHYQKSEFGEDNIATLQEGNINGIISSPPFNENKANVIHGQTKGFHSHDENESKNRMKRNYESPSNPESIGKLPIDSIVTSPPYEEGLGHGGKGNEIDRAKGLHARMAENRYNSAENIGNKVKETYWQAMATVYTECYEILKPRGWTAIVIKDFVRGGKIIPLCDNTVKLLEHLGFKVKYRARAHLVQDMATKDMFHGKTKKKQRKSFFRRLHESKNPGTEINWEEIIFVQKP